MNGYINGKVEIFCGEASPSSKNILWLKRVLSDGLYTYDLFKYDVNSNNWTSFVDSQSTNIDTLKNRDSLLLQLNGLPPDLFENYEQLLGVNIEQGEEITFTVDSTKNVILLYTNNGLIEKGVSSIVSTNSFTYRQPVILFVEKYSSKLSVSGDGQYDIESWTTFDVKTKTEIDFLANNFNTAQCDYVLNLIISNGPVTGTHTLNMYYNLSAPTGSLIATAISLGWTVNITF